MYVFPVPTLNGRIPVVSSRFRSEDRPDHIGADIMYKRLPEDGGPQGENKFPQYARRYYMPFGIPALAFASGVVQDAKYIGTGGYVRIDHGGGLESQYMHLENLKMQKGQQVKAGQVVGLISNNPIDTDPNHLHFQIKKNGIAVDPQPYLDKSTYTSVAGAFVIVLLAGLALYLSRILK